MTTAGGAVKQPTIPFNPPALEGSELEYVRQTVESGHTSSAGPFSERASPLHKSDAGRKVSVGESDGHVTDDMSGRLLRLPFSDHLTDRDSDRVVASLVSALERNPSGGRPTRGCGS